MQKREKEKNPNKEEEEDEEEEEEIEEGDIKIPEEVRKNVKEEELFTKTKYEKIKFDEDLALQSRN